MSQGSVATRLRCAWIFNRILLQIHCWSSQ